MNNNIIVVYDLETGGTDIRKSQIIQLSAVALDPKKLQPLKGGTFDSLIKPYEGKDCEKYGLEEPQEGALKVNKKTLKELRKAPEPKIVFQKFGEWLENFKTGNSDWDKPIRSGYNIHGFDDHFMDRYCVGQRHFDKETLEEPFGFGPVSNGKCGFFHPHSIDVFELVWFTFNNHYVPELQRSLGMDSVRDYFGLEGGDRHDGLQDCKDTAELLHRFNRLNSRVLKDGVAFKGSCKERLLKW